MNPLKRFRDIVISVVLVAAPFFFLKANVERPEQMSALDKAVLQLSGPIQYVATEAARATSSIIGDYVYLVDVKKENERLESENARFRMRLRRLDAVGDENKRLRELLQLQQYLGGESLPAQVIGMDFHAYFDVMRIRLDVGEDDAIKPGMPVIGPGGLVGKIVRVEGRYSDVRLVTDPRSNIDVRVRRTGARGMLKGTLASGRYLCRIEYLDRNDDVKVGDEVYTSGFGKDFPASILVGRVSKVLRRDFGLYQEVEVLPSVKFDRLEEVLVLTSSSRSTQAKRAEELE
ncbi:MAG: rod shape-determining protein MreC [Polyangiales bacterium]|nr:rod shape-determining protein MreC [Myxococcales bacterium]